MRHATVALLVAVATVAAGRLPTARGGQATVFVVGGVPKLVRAMGRTWTRGKGVLECKGVDYQC